MTVRRVIAVVLAASLLAAPAVRAAPAKPRRIMSMNMCADMIVLQLVGRDRIASVSYLAARGMADIDPALARGLPINHGTAEEILGQKPDLILAGDVSTPMTRKVAQKAGAPIVEVKSATSFDDIRALTRTVGAAVGEPERAEALIARMDRTLAALAADQPARPYEIAVWNGESTPGRGSLEDAVITAAGAVNVAARTDNGLYSDLSLEELLALKPAYVLFPADNGREPTVLGAAMHHRALRRGFSARTATYPESLLRCGVPQSAEAALTIRRQLDAEASR